jgi:hypothetical protein
VNPETRRFASGSFSSPGMSTPPKAPVDFAVVDEIAGASLLRRAPVRAWARQYRALPVRMADDVRQDPI